MRKLNLCQSCHKFGEKSSKIIPLGAPLSPAPSQSFSSQLQLRLPDDSYGHYGQLASERMPESGIRVRPSPPESAAKCFPRVSVPHIGPGCRCSRALARTFECPLRPRTIGRGSHRFESRCSSQEATWPAVRWIPGIALFFELFVCRW